MEDMGRRNGEDVQLRLTWWKKMEEPKFLNLNFFEFCFFGFGPSTNFFFWF